MEYGITRILDKRNGWTEQLAERVIPVDGRTILNFFPLISFSTLTQSDTGTTLHPPHSVVSGGVKGISPHSIIMAPCQSPFKGGAWKKASLGGREEWKSQRVPIDGPLGWHLTANRLPHLLLLLLFPFVDAKQGLDAVWWTRRIGTSARRVASRSACRWA